MQAGERTGLEPEPETVLRVYGTVTDAAADGGAGASSRRLDAESVDAFVASGGDAAERLPLKPWPPGASAAAAIATPMQQQPQPPQPSLRVGKDAVDSPPSAVKRLKAWVIRVGPVCLSNPDVQKHVKLIAVATVFCVFGFFLCLTGCVFIANPPHATYNLVFTVGGFVIFVPGIYYLVYVVRAYHGHEGYSFEDLPLMD